MKKIETPLIKWYITFTLILFGIAFLFGTGIIGKVLEADITKLSFLIGGLLVFYSVKIGKATYSLTQRKVDFKTPRKYLVGKAKKLLDRCKFLSNLFLDIGMIGTVIGFIYMLGISFTELSGADTAGMKMALQHMGGGMATALYTTAAGLISSVLIKLQIYPFERLIKEKDENEV